MPSIGLQNCFFHVERSQRSLEIALRIAEFGLREVLVGSFILSLFPEMNGCFCFSVFMGVFGINVSTYLFLG